MRIHRPTDCALLFAIPLTRRDFFADSQPRSGKEYARLFRAQLSGLSDELVWERYESAVVVPALSTIEFAERHGALTCTRASGEVWRQAVQQKQVVSLVAHWHAAGFTSEMIEELPELVAEVEAALGPAGRTMSAALASKQGEIGNPEGLMETLNESLRSTLIVSEEPQDGVTWVANDPEQVLHRNFEVVRKEFPHWSLPLPGMELTDGIYTDAEMAGRFSGEYDGTQDLRMCHSVILGEAIKRSAPKARVVMNQFPVRPAVQLPLYREALGMLESGKYEFAGAVIALNKAVVEKFR